MIPDEQITARLRQLRKTLESEFGEDLSGRKAVIREEVWPPTCSLLQGLWLLQYLCALLGQMQGCLWRVAG